MGHATGHRTLKKPTLKVEVIEGLQVIRCKKEDLDWEKGKSLSICIKDFRGQKDDPIHNTIHIEWFDGRLNIRTYDGGEDSVLNIQSRSAVPSEIAYLEPDPVLSHAVYCPPEELPKLLSTEDEQVKEIVEERLQNEKKN